LKDGFLATIWCDQDGEYDLWSNQPFRSRGNSALSHPRSFVSRGENAGVPHNLAHKKLDEFLNRMVLIYWQMIISFCHKACIWQTDGQTERQ